MARNKIVLVKSTPKNHDNKKNTITIKERLRKILGLNHSTEQDNKLDDATLEKLVTKYINLNGPKRKLARSYVIYLLAGILKISFENVVSLLKRKTPKRLVKADKSIDNSPKKPLTHFYSKKRKRDIEDQDPNRQIIINNSDINDDTYLPLKKIARIAELSKASPTKGYSEIMTTPTKQTKVRPFYHRTRAGKSLSLYTPITPEKESATNQVTVEKIKNSKLKKQLFSAAKPEPKNYMVKVAPIIDKDEFKEKLHNLTIKRATSLTFTVTLQDIEEARNEKNKRRISQNRLAGMRCADVFEAHGIAIIAKLHGSEYHWSHIRALCLKGTHSEDYLIPGTAASNYNTLELVENFILNKLVQEEIDKISVTFTPHYDANNLDSYLLDLISFTLTWSEHDKDSTHPVSCTETIYINPRSYQRATNNMNCAIEFVRGKQDALNTQSNSDVPAPTSADSEEELTTSYKKM